MDGWFARELRELQSDVSVKPFGNLRALPKEVILQDLILQSFAKRTRSQHIIEKMEEDKIP